MITNYQLRITNFLLLMIFAISLRAQIPIYGADSLMKHYNSKMNHFIDRDSSLGSFYSIDLFGISIFIATLFQHPP